jgi:hypothetical protein
MLRRMEDVYNGEMKPNNVGWRLDVAGLSHGHHDENSATDRSDWHNKWKIVLRGGPINSLTVESCYEPVSWAQRLENYVTGWSHRYTVSSFVWSHGYIDLSIVLRCGLIGRLN